MNRDFYFNATIFLFALKISYITYSISKKNNRFDSFREDLPNFLKIKNDTSQVSVITLLVSWY